MKPTVGRIVHFLMEECPPQAAIINRVNPDSSVNLTVFGHDGNTSLIRDVFEDDRARGMWWSWPPRDGS